LLIESFNYSILSRFKCCLFFPRDINGPLLAIKSLILYIDNIIIIATTNERKKIEKIDDNNYFNNLIDNFVPKSFKLS